MDKDINKCKECPQFIAKEKELLEDDESIFDAVIDMDDWKKEHCKECNFK